MSDETKIERDGDGTADALAVTALMGLIVLAAYIWLSGMPT